jgi:hypothetical protein
MGRVIDEYNALAGIFKFMTVDGEQPIFQVHKQIREMYQKNQERRTWAEWNKDAVWDWLSNHPEVLEKKVKVSHLPEPDKDYDDA